MYKYFLITAVVSLVLLGCQSLPSPATSKYVQTEGAGFGLVKGQWRYGIKYIFRKQFNGQIKGTVEFENPKKLGDWLASTFTIEPGEMNKFVSSEKLECIDNGKTYQIRLTLENQSGVIATYHE